MSQHQACISAGLIIFSRDEVDSSGDIWQKLRFDVCRWDRYTDRKLSLEANGLLQKCSRGRLAVKFMKTKSTTLQSENTDVVVVRTSYEYS
jgi:hypothetical protein